MRVFMTTLPSKENKAISIRAEASHPVPETSSLSLPLSLSKSVQVSALAASSQQERFGVFPVGVETPNGTMYTYTFVDLWSDVSLITEGFLARTGLGSKSNGALMIRSLHGVSNCELVADNLMLVTVVESLRVPIDKAYVVPELPMKAVPSIKQLTAKWSHLKNITFDELPNKDVSILIGADVQEAHEHLDDRFSKRGQAFALRFSLGCILSGRAH